MNLGRHAFRFALGVMVFAISAGLVRTASVYPQMSLQVIAIGVICMGAYVVGMIIDGEVLSE